MNQIVESKEIEMPTPLIFTDNAVKKVKELIEGAAKLSPVVFRAGRGEGKRGGDEEGQDFHVSEG